MGHPAKEALEAMYGICDSIDETPIGIKHTGQNMTLRKLLFLDISNFIMYLSASDGNIGWQEAKYLSELTEMNVTTSDMRELIEQNNIYSVSFEKKVPNVFPYFLKMDFAIMELGKKLDKPSVILLCEFFQTLGNHFIRCDREVDENEQRDLNIYLDTMVTYAQNEIQKKSLKATNSDNSLKSRYGALKKKQ